METFSALLRHPRKEMRRAHAIALPLPGQGGVAGAPGKGERRERDESVSLTDTPLPHHRRSRWLRCATRFALARHCDRGGAASPARIDGLQQSNAHRNPIRGRSLLKRSALTSGTGRCRAHPRQDGRRKGHCGGEGDGRQGGHHGQGGGYQGMSMRSSSFNARLTRVTGVGQPEGERPEPEGGRCEGVREPEGGRSKGNGAGQGAGGGREGARGVAARDLNVSIASGQPRCRRYSVEQRRRHRSQLELSAFV